MRSSPPSPNSKLFAVVFMTAFVSTTTAAHAEDRSFATGSLIIPMDLSYQSTGVFQAYGLLSELLRQGVPVSWVIDPNKTWHDADCDTAGDECGWDCAEEGSGIKCPYPTASPDFYAAAEFVWDDQNAAAPGTAIRNHGYRGGPLVIDAADRVAALAIIDVWNDPGQWAANPWAERSVFEVVTLHQATAPFTGHVKKQMLAAPTIAVFSDGNETIATSYLRAAGIKQSNGAEFPAAKCGAGDCGPGTANPDMLTVPSIMGDMGTCDAPNNDHKNGALFTGDGLPAYCQIMSMHWDVAEREKVECGGGACPATADECAGVPITYHGHEVVAEVRSFLKYPVHFFAECQAVNAYENTLPNPAWPYLDDAGRDGHFLTTTGTPPPCPCDPGPDEGAFECVIDGCGQGMDCCLPKDDKEKGAGFMIADSPSPKKVLRPEIPYNQFDGVFAPQGGSEPAYNLSTYLMTEYKNDRDVTFITAQSGPGVQDVWMTGYLDGECDIDDGPVVDVAPGGGDTGSCGGKVSYLGGHSYSGRLGQRLFLNALFEADCVTAAGQPDLSVSLLGETEVLFQSLPIDVDYQAHYENTGNGPALDGALRQVVSGGGLEVIAADGNGVLSPAGATWELGSIGGLAGDAGDPPAEASRGTTIRFTAEGDYPITVELNFRVGLNTFEASPRSYTIRVRSDRDGDGVADEDDVAPDDPNRCGDVDEDGCDDCSAGGTADPANDGPDADGDGICDAAGGGGCGCSTRNPAGASMLWLIALALLARRSRRRRRRARQPYRPVSSRSL
jgi:MYXO-CTERM domain-containing protein